MLKSNLRSICYFRILIYGEPRCLIFDALLGVTIRLGFLLDLKGSSNLSFLTKIRTLTTQKWTKNENFQNPYVIFCNTPKVMPHGDFQLLK